MCAHVLAHLSRYDKKHYISLKLSILRIKILLLHSDFSISAIFSAPQSVYSASWNCVWTGDVLSGELYTPFTRQMFLNYFLYGGH